MYYWSFVISWWVEHNFFFDKDSYSGGLKAISRLSAFLVNMNSKKKFPSPSSINVVFLFFDVSLTHLGTSKLLSTNHWWHGKLSCLKKKSNIIVKSVFFAPLPIYWNRFFCYFFCTNCVCTFWYMPATAAASRCRPNNQSLFTLSGPLSNILQN